MLGSPTRLHRVGPPSRPKGRRQTLERPAIRTAPTLARRARPAALPLPVPRLARASILQRARRPRSSSVHERNLADPTRSAVERSSIRRAERRSRRPSAERVARRQHTKLVRRPRTAFTAASAGPCPKEEMRRFPPRPRRSSSCACLSMRAARFGRVHDDATTRFSNE
jgi:hypothetical protein